MLQKLGIGEIIEMPFTIRLAYIHFPTTANGNLDYPNLNTSRNIQDPAIQPLADPDVTTPSGTSWVRKKAQDTTSADYYPTFPRQLTHSNVPHSLTTTFNSKIKGKKKVLLTSKCVSLLKHVYLCHK